MKSKARFFSVCWLAFMCAMLCGCWDNTEKLSRDRLMYSHLQLHSVEAADCNLHYQMIGAGDPIIVLHGGPGLDLGYLLPQMRWLASDHQVIFYDQRGSGLSWNTPINEQTITMEQFIQDLEAIRKDIGYQKFTLIGHSWGGLLAMQYAITYPEHLSALILMNSIPATTKGYQAFLQEYVQRTAELTSELEQIQQSEAFKKGENAEVSKFYRLIFSKFVDNPEDAKKIALGFLPQAALNGLKIADIFEKNYLLKEYDLLGDLSELQIPTLIVHGASDPIPAWTAQEIADTIPHAQLVILNQCGHFPYIEQPTPFFNVLKKFMATGTAA